MRAIKFRAWDNVAKEMHFAGEDADLIFQLGGEGIECADIRSITSAGDILNEMEHLLYMQYTGLKDKNGVEIYEGDVIKFCFKDGGDINTCYMEVLYREPSFIMKEIYRDYWLEKKEGGGLLLKHGVLKKYTGDISPLYKSNVTHWTEVIGNFHENPELLEVPE